MLLIFRTSLIGRKGRDDPVTPPFGRDPSCSWSLCGLYHLRLDRWMRLLLVYETQPGKMNSPQLEHL